MARWLTTATFRAREGRPVEATYEHPWLVRFTHWLNAVAILVMAASGLQILRAFPAFGPKVPEHDLVTIPGAIALGGWLAGGLQWHFTFMWFFLGASVLYVVSQAVSGRYRMVIFHPRDVPGVWPMVRHYFLFGPKPPLAEPYNPLQKLAYTTTLALGAVSLVTGLVLYKPAQFSLVAGALGGFRATRIWHFAAMCGLLAFIPGHLVMVALHGWNNFAAMLIGWKREPEYLSGVRSPKSQVGESESPSVRESGSPSVQGSESPETAESEAPEVRDPERPKVRDSGRPTVGESEVPGGTQAEDAGEGRLATGEADTERDDG